MFGPLILLYSSKNFDVSVPKGAPVLLKSQVTPTGRDRHAKQRTIDFFSARTSKMKRKLLKGQVVHLDQTDVLDLLHPIR